MPFDLGLVEYLPANLLRHLHYQSCNINQRIKNLRYENE